MKKLFNVSILYSIPTGGTQPPIWYEINSPPIDLEKRITELKRQKQTPTKVKIHEVFPEHKKQNNAISIGTVTWSAGEL